MKPGDQPGAIAQARAEQAAVAAANRFEAALEAVLERVSGLRAAARLP